MRNFITGKVTTKVTRNSKLLIRLEALGDQEFVSASLCPLTALAHRSSSLWAPCLFASGTKLCVLLVLLLCCCVAVLLVLLSTLLAVLAAVLPVLPHYWLCWRRVAVLPCVEIGLAEHFFSFRIDLYLPRLYTTLVSLVDANTPSSNAIHLFSSTYHQLNISLPIIDLAPSNYFTSSSGNLGGLAVKSSPFICRSHVQYNVNFRSRRLRSFIAFRE